MADLTGTSGNDVINGTNAADVILGLAGDDVIFGALGDDDIDGGADDDEINGFSGDDVIVGGSGNDLIRGSIGFDNLSGGDGSDRFLESRYSDNDVIDGGDDDDTVVYEGSDTDSDTFWIYYDLTATVGMDRFFVESKIETNTKFERDQLLNVEFVEFNDTIISLTQSNAVGLFEGSGADDSFSGSIYADRLFGFGGVDSLTGGLGDDELFGGDDNDVLNGNSHDDTLWGEDGDDTLNGGNGNDRLVGGAGQDTLSGGFGVNTFVFAFLEELASGGDEIVDFSASNIIETDVDEFIHLNAFTGNGQSELRYEQDFVAGKTYFHLDSNGDGIQDATIVEIDGVFEFFGTADRIVSLAATERQFTGQAATDLVFQNVGNGTFQRLLDPLGLNQLTDQGRSGFTAIGVADLDGNTDPELILRAPNSNYVLQEQADNGLATTVGGRAFDLLGFADLDADGADEAIGLSTDPGDTRFLLIDDALTSVQRIGFRDQTLLGFGDFDGDGGSEGLFVRASGSKALFDSLNGALGVGRTAYNIAAIADFNGDGLDDVLTRNTNRNDHYYLLEGDEAAPLRSAVFLGNQALDIVAVGDFDGDGTQDALFSRGGTSFQTLTQGLTTLTVINFGNDSFEAIGDFNGDGIDDILLRRVNGNGRLVLGDDRTTAFEVGELNGKTLHDVADYDGDGRDDLLLQDDVTGDWSVLPGHLGSEAELALDPSLTGDDLVTSGFGIDTLGLTSNEFLFGA